MSPAPFFRPMWASRLPTGRGGTEFLVIDVLDTLGLPGTITYPGGTIHTQYYARTGAAGFDPMAARAALDLLGVAGIAPGATIRLRLFVTPPDFRVGATVDRISILIPQGTTPSSGHGPIEGPPIGGADDLFGACAALMNGCPWDWAAR